ncbi:MAG: hypothetical protein AAF420_08830, partial [Pseudomonadota bacterium]
MRSSLLLVLLLVANLVVGAWLFMRPVANVVKDQPLAALKAEEGLALVNASQPLQVLTEAARECRIWGPDSNREAFADLHSALAAEGGLPEVIEKTVEATPDFLVYVDRLGSVNNLRAASVELKRMNIDSYLISRTPLKLSVGVFSSADRATRLQRTLTDLGYGVAVETLPRSQIVYTLSAHVLASSPLYQKSVSSCSE